METVFMLAILMSVLAQTNSTPVQETPAPAGDAAAAAASPEVAEKAPEVLPPLPEVSVEKIEQYSDDIVRMATTYGPRILGALLFLFGAWIVASWVSRLIVAALTRAKADVTLAKFLGTTARWAVLAVAAVAGLGIFGVQTASFAAVIGSAGLAIGLAMQGSLANLAAGVLLLVFRPFRVGDVVAVGGQVGKVDEIELFSTRIDTADNRRVIIPNSAVFGATIENQSYHKTRPASVTVTVDGSFQLEQTRAILLQAALQTQGRIESHPPAVAMTKLTGGSPDWTITVWADNASLADVQQSLLISVKQTMDHAGLSGPVASTMLRLPPGATLTGGE